MRRKQNSSNPNFVPDTFPGNILSKTHLLLTKLLTNLNLKNRNIFLPFHPLTLLLPLVFLLPAPLYSVASGFE